MDWVNIQVLVKDERCVDMVEVSHKVCGVGN